VKSAMHIDRQTGRMPTSRAEFIFQEAL